MSLNTRYPPPGSATHTDDQSYDSPEFDAAC
jgi:hypothetical protein